MTRDGARILRNAAFTALALIALIALVPAPHRVLTIPVSARIPLGGTHVYLAMAIFDPQVSEIHARYLILGPRPHPGHFDFVRFGPEWTKVTPGLPDDLDIRPAQLAQVENGIRALGFAADRIHGWIVSAPTGNRSLRVGEIFLDLGPPIQAPGAMARFSSDSSEPIKKLEEQARVHIAFAWAQYYKPDCGTTANETKSRLKTLALDEKADLENAAGYRLSLNAIESTPPPLMLCPKLHPVTIDSTIGWYGPIPSAYRNEVISGVARYDIGMSIAHVIAPTLAPAESDGGEPYEDLRSADQLTARTILTTSMLGTKLQPSIALLWFPNAGVRVRRSMRMSSGSHRLALLLKTFSLNPTA